MGVASNRPTTIEHHTVEVKDVRLHYAIAGEGNPVVLLHGFPQTWKMWEHEMLLLGDRFRVIAPDLRGFGQSSKPMHGYDMDNMADDIHELVVSLGYRDIFLAGHDWGGAVAYNYAALFPTEVRRLANLEMVFPGFEEYDRFTEAQPKGKYFWEMHFGSVPDLPAFLISGREEAYFGFIFEYWAHDPDAVSPDKMRTYFESMRAIGNPAASLGVYRDAFQSAEQNREHRKTPLEMPVLALGGDACTGDAVISCSEAAAVDVRGRVIEKCGHWICEERPGLLAEELGQFFGEQS